MRTLFLLTALILSNALTAAAQAADIGVGKVLAFDRDAQRLVLTDRSSWSLASATSRIHRNQRHAQVRCRSGAHIRERYRVRDRPRSKGSGSRRQVGLVPRHHAKRSARRYQRRRSCPHRIRTRRGRIPAGARNPDHCSVTADLTRAIDVQGNDCNFLPARKASCSTNTGVQYCNISP